MIGFSNYNGTASTYINAVPFENKTYVTPVYSESFKEVTIVNTKQLNKDRLSKLGRSTYGPQKLTRKK